MSIKHFPSKWDENRTQDNDSCGSVSNLLILGPAELDHALRSGVRNFDLTKDGVAIVGQNNAAHGVEQHLQHGLGTET